MTIVIVKRNKELRSFFSFYNGFDGDCHTASIVLKRNAFLVLLSVIVALVFIWS